VDLSICDVADDYCDIYNACDEYYDIYIYIYDVCDEYYGYIMPVLGILYVENKKIAKVTLLCVFWVGAQQSDQTSRSE
jgi:hypothetical protein